MQLAQGHINGEPLWAAVAYTKDKGLVPGYIKELDNKERECWYTWGNVNHKIADEEAEPCVKIYN